MAQSYDIVIRGGTVLDGAGGEPFEADVAVQGGVIREVGRVAGSGREEIDARGKIVTPGFVDIHTHYDGQVTWEHRLMPSSNHGVTTVVMGNCGVGFAPAKPDQRELLIKLMEGVEDIPDVVMAEGVPWNWETFPEYLDALEARHSDIDFAAQLPHSPLRVYVMGERGAGMEVPTEADLAEMRRLTTEAVKAGAVGVSTSRNLAHRFRDGRPAPSVETEEREVLALAEGLRDARTGVFQILSSAVVSHEAQFNLIRRVAETAQRPVSFTFLDSEPDPNKAGYMLEQLKIAQAQGLQIRGQTFPRPPAVLMGLEVAFHPFALNPSFQKIADLPLAEKVAAMRDPEFRRQLLSEKPESPNPHFMFIVSEQKLLFPLGDPPNYNPSRGDSIGAIAERTGRDPLEVAYDALLQRDGHELLYRPLTNMRGDRFEDSAKSLLGQPGTVLGLGDGGAHYSSICDAAYPTYFLEYWIRDATPDRKIELPQAIKLLCHDPAVAVGFLDRGLVREGMKADLNVIDLDRLHVHAPRVTYDLPAGGHRLSQDAEGYCATLVSGQITYREGEATGALPGRLVRGQQPEPV